MNLGTIYQTDWSGKINAKGHYITSLYAHLDLQRQWDYDIVNGDIIALQNCLKFRLHVVNTESLNGVRDLAIQAVKSDTTGIFGVVVLLSDLEGIKRLPREYGNSMEQSEKNYLKSNYPDVWKHLFLIITK